MAVKVRILQSLCEIEGGDWTSSNKPLARALNRQQEILESQETFSNIPNSDLYFATKMIEFLRGEIVDEGPEPESVPGRIY